MLLDVLIIQNLALYEVFRMLIQDKGETQDFRGCRLRFCVRDVSDVSSIPQPVCPPLLD